jgi:predicted transcriptional regulator
MTILTQENDGTTLSLLGMATDIVAAHVSNTGTDASELPKLLRTVYNSLTEIMNGRMALADRPEPAVSVKKSVTDEYIICLEDGKKLKMLKRHLKSAYNMSPDQYRERWNLPLDYPMVAPNYAKERSKLAVQIGLGRKRKYSSDMAA